MSLTDPPFGRCNPQATFQSLMFQILDKVLNKFALVIIYSDTIKPHPAFTHSLETAQAKHVSKLNSTNANLLRKKSSI
jgi:hypothetical protein